MFPSIHNHPDCTDTCGLYINNALMELPPFKLRTRGHKPSDIFLSRARATFLFQLGAEIVWRKMEVLPSSWRFRQKGRQRENSRCIIIIPCCSWTPGNPEMNSSPGCLCFRGRPTWDFRRLPAGPSSTSCCIRRPKIVRHWQGRLESWLVSVRNTKLLFLKNKRAV